MPKQNISKTKDSDWVIHNRTYHSNQHMSCHGAYPHLPSRPMSCHGTYPHLPSPPMSCHGTYPHLPSPAMSCHGEYPHHSSHTYLLFSASIAFTLLNGFGSSISDSRMYMFSL